MNESNVVFRPEARLTSCEEQSITIGLPGPLNERLDSLVDLADDEGAKTNRKELVAALILAASESASELANAVIALRKAKVRDAAVVGDLAAVLKFQRHQPGPRRRAASKR
jgi:hypothetical protein